ncbi:MAG: PRC-barrel domain-containing protein [Anaerolineae bacterium]|nr:PRC-barrel domain-containing protein [Anaerolineae bacterium]
MTTLANKNTELDLNIGADIYCNEGRCGKLTHVVIDPSTQRVTDLVVEKGFLQKEDRVIPVSAVDQASGDEIRVDIVAEDFEAFPEYDEQTVRLPAGGYRGERYQEQEVLYFMGRYSSIVVSEPVVPTVEHKVQEGVPNDLDVIGAGTPVRNVLDDLGEVDHLLVHSETNRVTHLVVKTKGLFSDYPVVPITQVNAIHDDGVFLDLTEEQLEAYPRYTPSA